MKAEKAFCKPVNAVRKDCKRVCMLDEIATQNKNLFFFFSLNFLKVMEILEMLFCTAELNFGFSSEKGFRIAFVQNIFRKTSS